jgi:hypothetical protein
MLTIEFVHPPSRRGRKSAGIIWRITQEDQPFTEATSGFIFPNVAAAKRHLATLIQALADDDFESFDYTD